MSDLPAHVSPRESFWLAGVGGCIDAIGLLTLGGLFVSHMSGNTAALGAAFGQGHWGAGWPHLFAVPVFLAGLFTGYYWTEGTPSARRCASILFFEVLLLSLFGGGLLWQGQVESGTGIFFLLATPALFAMGMQNATLRQIGRSTFPSTYVTGVLDRSAKSLAAWARARGTAKGREAARDALASLGVWGSYVTGALAGSFGILFLQAFVLVLPISILGLLGWRLWRRPA